MTKHIDRLTRYEADIVVRQLTGRYYDKYGFDNSERFDDFAAKLAWQIGGENTRDFQMCLLDALKAIYLIGDDYWTYRADNSHRIHWEGQFNEEVNHALSAANIPGEYIRRYGPTTTTRKPVAG